LIVRYNQTYRTEVLNVSVFESLEQVREISAEWVQSDNEERPHDALAGLPPATGKRRNGKHCVVHHQYKGYRGHTEELPRTTDSPPMSGGWTYCLHSIRLRRFQPSPQY